MTLPDHETRPVFSQPVRQVLMMLIVLGLSGFGGFLALPRVLPVFQANPYLNGFIIFVFFRVNVLRNTSLTIRRLPSISKRQRRPQAGSVWWR